VISSRAVAQVTLHNEPALQVLYGAASGRRALLFSLESYTDEARSWGDRVGVALFRFDPQGQPEPTNCHAAALMQEALSRTAGHAAVPALLDHRAGAGAPAFPTLISDARAVAIVRKQAQGILVHKEVLAWIRQSWINLYRVRTDFTSKSGLRNELRFASSYQWFETISGQPFTLKALRTLQPTHLVDDAAAPIHARVPAADVINATVKTWNTYCGLGDKKALKRHAAMLNARGVPAHIAETINVEVESQILLPVFVGLLTHSTGHRLVVLDGVAGRLQSGVAAGMTSNYRYVMAALDENRLVRLGTA
ncbi:MAG TPA: hypothetical protein VKQ71_01450, partial [Acidimicrobiales bacterium]|nr:hypothetical protein [Acidimicrobiales bacterium]